MKTSCAQFDLMMTFMEQHGDLSKPSSNAKGRISTLRFWEELTQLLNSDGSGDTKTCDKWKKVWSDFKNNTKKKAARLHRAASGTGGGPAVFAKLTDLEHRVLNLIGVQVATGLQVEEAGLSQVIDSVENDPSITTPHPHQSVEFTQHDELVPQSASPVPPQLSRAVSSLPHIFMEEEVQPSQPCNEPQPGPSTAPQTRAETFLPFSHAETQFEETGLITPTRPKSQVHVDHAHTEPTRSGQTTPRRARLIHPRGSPRRREGLTHTDQAAQFLQAEEFWRKFKIQQHKDYMDLRREQNRIREMEVQAQTQWQHIGLRALDILDKLVNKYCKD